MGEAVADAFFQQREENFKYFRESQNPGLLETTKRICRSRSKSRCGEWIKGRGWLMMSLWRQM